MRKGALNPAGAIMWLSAEVRWFWRDACPEGVRDWFYGGPTAPAIPPAGEPSERVDRYLHAKGNTEIGIKARDARDGRPDDVEIKGLVAVVSPPDPLAGDAAIPSIRSRSGASGRRRRSWRQRGS